MNPKIGNLIQYLNGIIRILHDNTFGNFKLQTITRHAGFSKNRFDRFHQTTVLQLITGKIYCHTQPFQAILLPSHVLATGLPQNPLTQFHNQPIFLCHLNKFCWCQEAKFRMLPAHKCLCRNNTVSCHIHLWLIIKPEFTTF